MVIGVGPVHALPSTCLEKVEEQPEDADNQRNVTRMEALEGSARLSPGRACYLAHPPTGSPYVPSLFESVVGDARRVSRAPAHKALSLPQGSP